MLLEMGAAHLLLLKMGGVYLLGGTTVRTRRGHNSKDGEEAQQQGRGGDTTVRTRRGHNSKDGEGTLSSKLLSTSYW